MGELGTLTMEQVRAMDNATLRVLVARMLGWSDIHEQWIEWEGKRIFDYQGVPAGAGGHDARLPAWPDCLDDAITLLVGRRVELQSSGADWGARVGHWVGGDGWERAETPAHAVALAWVAWKLAQGG